MGLGPGRYAPGWTWDALRTENGEERLAFDPDLYRTAVRAFSERPQMTRLIPMMPILWKLHKETADRHGRFVPARVELAIPGEVYHQLKLGSREQLDLYALAHINRMVADAYASGLVLPG